MSVWIVVRLRVAPNAEYKKIPQTVVRVFFVTLVTSHPDRCIAIKYGQSPGDLVKWGGLGCHQTIENPLMFPYDNYE